jgi:hypothetical protein
VRDESQAAKWAAACARFKFRDVIEMSYPHWEPVHSNNQLPHGQPANGAVRDEPHIHSADMAIDAALRGVPLPDGLLTRLDKFVHAMTDESANPFDWLGC